MDSQQAQDMCKLKPDQLLHGERKWAQGSTLAKETLIAVGRGRVGFLSVDPGKSATLYGRPQCSNGRPHIHKFMGSAIWT